MKQPNILWICSDQQRWDTIHALGNKYIRTPNIDRLVAGGVSCLNTYCQSTICTPSRASFLTGMYPSTIHACGNGNERWVEAAPLVTKLLADAGYFCGLSGKLHLSGCAGRTEPRPEDDGYALFHWSQDHRDLWPVGHAYAEWVKDQGGDLGAIYAEKGYMPSELHQTKFCADKAIEFIEEKRDEPWLMSVNIYDPHEPFDPPPEYRDRYIPDDVPGPLFREGDLAAQAAIAEADFQTPPRRPDEFKAKETIAAYYAMIEQLDDHVGRMMAALERTGQLEETLVIFHSDHGEMLGDHGLLLKGCRFYEGLVHVPMILSWKGVLPEGRRTEALVELTDIAPTLLDYAGVAGADKMAGKSLRALLEGKTDTHRPSVRCEYYRALSPTTPGRENWTGTYATMIRDARYKLITYHGTGKGELFDLESDPGEFDNLWNNPAVANIRFRLVQESFDQTAFAVDPGSEQTLNF